MTTSKIASDADLRTYAAKQLKKKRDFVQSALAYVIVNAGLIAIWYFLSPDEHFWPMWVIFGWGIGLAFQFVDAYIRPFSQPITESDIDAEVAKIKAKSK